MDKNRTGACGLGRNRRLLRHTELVFLSTVCARRVVLVLFTNMDATTERVLPPDLGRSAGPVSKLSDGGSPI